VVPQIAPGGSASVSLSDPDWLALVARHPESTPFHHPAWAKTLAEAYRFDAGGSTLEGPAGAVAALPFVALGRIASRRRLVSLPFTDWCAPLLTGEPGPWLAEALEARRADGALAAIEIRDGPSSGLGHDIPAGYRHELGLGADFEAIAAGFHKSKVRRKLRRAEREGVEVRRAETAQELLETFYPLHVGTRKRLGVPVQPRRFFEVLGERMIEAGLGFVLTAYAAGTPVSSAVFLAWNGHLIYKFSASSRDLGDVGAGQSVVAEAIRWGCENGYGSIDFGRTDQGAEGLRAFKLSWGATEHDLVYSVFADRPPRTGSGRANQLLEHLIRRSPELLTRAIGRAAYRYSA
jgi:CelD/BcsL family acetyltransferase involved in cellulose biosynthesis